MGYCFVTGKERKQEVVFWGICTAVREGTCIIQALELERECVQRVIRNQFCMHEFYQNKLVNWHLSNLVASKAAGLQWC